MNSLKDNIIGSEDMNQMTETSERCVDPSVDALIETIDYSEVCYLSVHYSDSKCGATLYHSNTHTIQCINELEDIDFNSLEALLIQTEPNHVIISSKSDPKLIELLKSCANQTNDESEEKSVGNGEQLGGVSAKSETTSASDLLWKMEFRFDLDIVSHTLFGFENAKNRILSINTINNIELKDEQKKILYFSSLIDFSNNNTLKSFGALLRFLDFNCIDIQMQTNRSTVEISGISRLYLQQLVTIERNSYESLQIFQQEWHPSATRQGLHQKEGLSLYGLFNCCVSKIGANYLRKLFLMPTQEIDVIMDRLEAIEFFIEPKNHVLRDNLNHHLKHIKSVTALFNRFINSSAFTLNDLQTITNNLLNALRIRDIIVGQNTDLQVFRQIKESFTQELDQLFNGIHYVLDLNKSIRNQSFEINVGIDEELDQTKYIYNRLPELLEVLAEKEFNTFRQFMNECNCVFIPQIGFLTSCQAFGQTPPHVLTNQLKYLVKVGDRFYYKTEKTLYLDQTLGDIHADIIDRQMQITNRLIEQIVDKKYLFVSIIKCCAKLDALIAMSRTAISYNYTKPKLTNDGIIEIVDGRHPLIELMSNGFVFNNYQSGGQNKKVKLISGPNACGKSVYLKQICIIVYLAHIGSYVPALRANISIVDRIFTRIHTPESISLRLSTFMLDLKQISNATKNSTKRSLVVVDEFGKGTQPIDGLALMAAFIDHWLTENTPHLIVSSHFRCLPSIINKNQLIECQTFQIRRTPKDVKYLFKLIDGHSKDSIASQIAYLAGVPENIIKRGVELTEVMANNMSIKCTQTEELKRKYKNYEEIAVKFLELNVTSEEEIINFFRTLSECSLSEE